MDRQGEIRTQFAFERDFHTTQAEVWYIRSLKDDAVCGQLCCIYLEDGDSHLVLTLEAEYLEAAEDVLDVFVDMLGIQEYVCTIAEIKDQAYLLSDDYDEADEPEEDEQE